MTTVDLHNIFGTEALAGDASELVAQLMKPLQGPHVLTHVMVAAHEFNARIFSPEAHGYGRFAYLLTGERLYCRVNSYFGSSRADVAPLEELRFGETRILSFVVSSINSPFHVGSSKVVIAKYLLNQTDHPDAFPEKTSGLSINNPASQAVFGISCSPVVLIDRFVGRSKKVVAIEGHVAVWCGSTTLCDTWRAPSTTIAERGIQSIQLAEWVAGCAPSRFESGITAELSTPTFDGLFVKSAARVEATIKASLAHPKEGADIDPVRTFVDAKNVAHVLLERLTLGGIIDLISADVYAGIPVFDSPTGFALYASVCVLLAHSPESARLPVSGQCEDRVNASAFMRLYQALVPGVDMASRTRCSALEALVQTMCDGILKSDAPKGDTTTFKSVYQTTRAGKVCEEVTDVPFVVESMRRQGAALVQELYGTIPIDFEAHQFQKLPMEKALWEEGFFQTTNVVSQNMLACKRKAKLIQGSITHLNTEISRVSNLNARQRTLLTMMIDVNEFLMTGVYCMRRVCADNSAQEYAAAGAHTGIQRNIGAMRMGMQAISDYFNHGVKVLIEQGLPRAMPLRFNTRTKCGDCGEQFDPRETIGRDLLTGCQRCGIMFCNPCYKRKVEELKAYNNGNTLTYAVLAEHTHALMCTNCSSSSSRRARKDGAAE